jgi:hypothetical protein
MYVNHKIVFLFHIQVYGHEVNEHPESSTVRHGMLNTENEDVLVNLELSQPQSVQRDKSETPSTG